MPKAEWRKRYHSYGPALSIEYTVTYFCTFSVFIRVYTLSYSARDPRTDTG